MLFYSSFLSCTHLSVSLFILNSFIFLYIIVHLSLSHFFHLSYLGFLSFLPSLSVFPSVFPFIHSSLCLSALLSILKSFFQFFHLSYYCFLSFLPSPQCFSIRLFLSSTRPSASLCPWLAYLVYGWLTSLSATNHPVTASPLPLSLHHNTHPLSARRFTVRTLPCSPASCGPP